jgi:hypothetical protein
VDDVPHRKRTPRIRSQQIDDFIGVLHRFPSNASHTRPPATVSATS